MTTETFDLERRVRRLRRRLAVERTLFGFALLTSSGGLLYPRLFSPACTLVVGGRPLVAVADRATAERVLASLAQASDVRRQAPGETSDVRRQASAGASVGLASGDWRLTPAVTLARGNRAGVDVEDEADAARALAGAVTVVAPRAAILANGKPVAGLASEAEARAALEMVKSYYAELVPQLEEEPTFKETVAVRTISMPVARCYPTPRAAAEALRGAGAALRGSYRVRPGETAWEIAHRNHLTLGELQRLNPGSALHPLHPGRTLRIHPAPRPPLTVIVKRQVRATQLVGFPTQKKPSAQMFQGKHLLLQPGRPGKVMLTTAILYENGVPAGKQLLAREVLIPTRPKVVAVGTRTRG